jgi:hypothetical protein
MTQNNHPQAPSWEITHWFNTPEPLSLECLHGKIIVIEAFQMLCPGCVSHGLPLATRVSQMFDSSRVAVIGLHTVFEHHQVMTKEALEVFIHEYRIPFPIGIDTPDPENAIPLTMGRYAMQGTPSLILIDHKGRIRQHHYGSVSDLQLGVEIAELLFEANSEKAEVNPQSEQAVDSSDNCSTGKCAI